jgi:hypothetical protein
MSVVAFLFPDCGAAIREFGCDEAQTQNIRCRDTHRNIHKPAQNR